MEIDMITLTKPIPDSPLHDYDDDTIKAMIKFWRKDMELEPDQTISPLMYKNLIDNAYKVLGYRCAIQYLEMYGDE
jgi:hypothetical protein